MKRCPLLALALLSLAQPAAAEPVELAAFQRLARPEPPLQIAYGPAPSQTIDVFRPDTPGPHPVAVLIHGGCWSVTTAGREQLRHLAADLTARGVAVWSVGYRRADEPGGGYAGTYKDVAAALDRLPQEADRLGLDASRTVLVGHSAGGHLALWAAARPGLPRESPLWAEGAMFRPGAVISLAGVPDLAAFGRFVPLFCGPGVLESLAPAAHLAEVSPAALPAPAVPSILVSGVLDRLVPPYVAHDYARQRRSAGATPPDLVDIPGAGHFDLVSPGAPAWEEVRRLIVTALERSPEPSPPVAFSCGDIEVLGRRRPWPGSFVDGMHGLSEPC